MLYFWNINNLINDLRNGLVTEYEKMVYFIMNMLFMLQPYSNKLDITTNTLDTLKMNTVAALSTWVLILVMIVGIIHCYRINQNGDNKNFLERFICLSVPLLIRFVVFGILGILIYLLIIYVIYLFALKSILSPNYEPVVLLQIAVAIFSIGLRILFYYVLGKKIAEISAP